MMKLTFSRGMAQATRLTRAGKLHEATATLMSMLTPTAAARVVDGSADAIEGTFTPLDTPPPSKPRRPAPPLPRAPLSQTLDRIAAGGLPRKARPKARAVAVPPGAQFLALTHSGSAGRRDYRLYVPAARAKGPMPLVVMLHGCTQSPEDFAAGTRMNALAEREGFLVAWPAQPSGANMQKCWNWFRPEDQARGRGEPALLAGIVADILRDHPADAGRVYVAGLSAGGAAAAILAGAYPDVFSAVGVHSGLAAGAASDVPSAFAAMRSGSTGTAHPTAVPTIVMHGASDTTVHPQNGTAALSQAMQAMPTLQETVRVGVSESGRRFRTTAHRDDQGRSMAEHWVIEGAGHAWSGGSAAGSYTDPDGPDASGEMVRFFLQHRKAG